MKPDVAILTKTELRDRIRLRKKESALSLLEDESKDLMQKLEQHPRFLEAQTVLLYYSLPDEVFTHQLVERWSGKKEILLPVVSGEELALHRYVGKENLREGSFGIWEPTGVPFTAYETISFVLVPGMAFDLYGNRLGRGKGFYDRLLPKLINAYKLGICFSFQYLDFEIPHDNFDCQMNEVLSPL